LANAANDFQFWLTFNNGEQRLRLPVNPETIRVTTTRGYDDVTIAQLGEYTVIGNEMLHEYSISSFFPRDYNGSYCEYEDIALPYESVALIESWIVSRRPIRLTVTGIINIPVTIRSFTYEERAGHVGDVWFDLSLKEYRFIEFKRVSSSKAGTVTVISASKKRANPSVKVTSYTVKSGDTLTKIAAKATVYGDVDKWRDIYNANKTLIGGNPNALKVGQTLVIA
jgi:nucleoid-associated protein YgaU